MALDLIADLTADGVEVMVATTHPASNDRVDDARARGADVRVLSDLVPRAMVTWAIVDLARRHRVDVVHVLNSREGYDAIPALSQLVPAPRVVAHLQGEEGPGRGYPHYACALYAGGIDMAIAVSDDLAGIVEGYGMPPDRIRVVRPTIDLQHFMQSPFDGAAGPLRVLMPARISDDKDPLLAVRAIAAAREGGLDVTLTLAGDGPLMPDVRREVAHLGLTDQVSLPGIVDDMATAYASHDVVMLTSRFEASPLAICEAMACGVPVVAPAIGGIPELVGDDAGILVSERAPAAIAAALAALADPHTREAIGRRGRQRAEALLSRNATSDAMRTAYRDLLALPEAV